MRFLIASLFALASVSQVAARTLWTDLRDNSQYNYDDWRGEFAAVAPKHSQQAFEANLKEIRDHNARAHESFKKGVNKFTGMTKDEFKAYIGRGYRKSLSSHNEASPLHHSKHHNPHRHHADLTKHKSVEDLPASLDWRDKNVVTAVKDQGMCGGCWSFSTAETVESAVALSAGGKLLTLSEQEILACTQNPQHCGGTGGCEGATQELGFSLVQQKGITTEATWPYTGSDSTCTFGTKKVAAGISGYVALPANNYTALVNAGATMPIAISAAAMAWQMYESGVLTASSCDVDVDHAIQLVGWGVQGSTQYWLVRNSWGPSWGESGYIRIERFGEGKEPCATDSSPGDGDGCAGGPASITVCGACGILSDSSYPTGAHIVN